METIELVPLWHKDMFCIAIRGRFGEKANQIIRDFPNRFYSKTHGCWYVKHSPANLDLLFQCLSVVTSVVIPFAFDENKHSVPVPSKKLTPLPKGYSECLIRMRYSESTRITYENQMRLFTEFIQPLPIHEITKEIVDRYMSYLVETRKVSVSTQNTAINAIKFYLEQVNKGERTFYYVDRPIREKLLPSVLSEDEMFNMLDCAKNTKHRCMMFMLYSAGLRISELLNLKWPDIDCTNPL